MRAVVQRVKEAGVKVAGETVGSIGHGILAFLGVGRNDAPQDAAILADKIVHLRIFDDEKGRMNLSLLETRGEILVVSQFTLYGDCRKGRRPSYSLAAPPAEAENLYKRFIQELSAKNITVATGTFQALMEVSLVNDGPVTLLLDTEKISSL